MSAKYNWVLLTLGRKLFLLLCVSTLMLSASAETTCSTAPAEIYESSSPAVVYIHAISINPFRQAERVEHVVGSGFIIDAEGLVVTNSHVAFGRQSLTVKLGDGTTLPARLLGADPIFDIAILQIPKPKNASLPTLKLGNSDNLRVGEEVLALGNPLGLEQSLTRGIVSATNRVLPATFFALQEPLIQVDTPINHGNSGGPLLNRCGEVVGITTAVISEAQNIGLVIPINLAKSVIPELLYNGRLVRPWVGFHGQFIDDELSELLRIPLRTGFLVEVIEPGSPAAQANLQGGDLEMTIGGREFLLGGDIITSLNGKQFDTPANIVAAMQGLKVGDEVCFTVFRHGKEVNVKYQLQERPLMFSDVTPQNAAAQVTRKNTKQPSLSF